MTLNNIEFAVLSKYRSSLMGLAMLFIVLFHVGVPRHNPFFCLHRIGNIGVDMFLFLSGIGLWYAWSKNPSYIHFIKRRFVRIYPTWLIVALMFYLPDFLQQKRYSTSFIDFLGDILINWNFWLNDELTFWYIPAIMVLYVTAPLYMKVIERYREYRYLPILFITWCFMVQMISPIHNALGHIEIFWSRVPIFFIGINMGEAVKSGKQLSLNSIWLIIVTFAATFATCVYLEQQLHGRFPLFLERMLYIPLTFCSLILLSILISKLPTWINKILVIVGTLSLEIYLTHAHFVLKYIQQLHIGYWGTTILCIIIALPLSYLLHKIVGYGEKIITGLNIKC